MPGSRDLLTRYDLQLVINDGDGDALHSRGLALLAMGELDRAMIDFKRAGEVDTENAMAYVQYGRYQMCKGSYRNAISAFGTAIGRQPGLACAYLGRAEAHLELYEFTEAVRDLSQCIHLDPGCAEAFFRRGAALQTSHPRQALNDLSASILVDCTVSNLRAYLHRGMLYLQMGKPKAADPDFRMVLLLDEIDRIRRPRLGPSSPRLLALCHLGLINMVYLGNYAGAARQFGQAVQEDPTYVRARLCRAECLYRVHKDCGGAPFALRRAVTEYGKAIRLDPSKPEYFILRGKMLLELGELELARYHVGVASALQRGSGGGGEGGKVTVEAQVQSFLDNHGEAVRLMRGLVDTLETMTVHAHSSGANQLMLPTGAGDPPPKTRPAAPARPRGRAAGAFVGGADEEEAKKLAQVVQCHRDLPPATALLGRILARAGRHHEAAECFEQALSYDNRQAGWFYELGSSAVQLGDDTLAAEAFHACLALESGHSRAHYMLGACRLRRGEARGIRSVNKALALRPSLWEAYLTRASFYGAIGRLPKAILNCNEAIALQPRAARAFLTRGSLKFQAGHVASAIEDLGTSCQLDPSCSLTFFNRAICHQKLGSVAKALADYSAVLLIEDEPPFVVFLNRAVLYTADGDWGNALLDFRRLGEFKQMRGSVHVLHAMGICLHRLGRLEEAVVRPHPDCLPPVYP